MLAVQNQLLGDKLTNLIVPPPNLQLIFRTNDAECSRKRLARSKLFHGCVGVLLLPYTLLPLIIYFSGWENLEVLL